MTYIVTENCIKCKYMDCVEVCPVDCFYEGENMLVIHPDECIDCGVCEPECPAEAIKPDTEPGLESWLTLNTEYRRSGPTSLSSVTPPPTPRNMTENLTNLASSRQILAKATRNCALLQMPADSCRINPIFKHSAALRRVRTAFPLIFLKIVIWCPHVSKMWGFWACPGFWLGFFAP